jgi:hypothetical protein
MKENLEYDKDKTLTKQNVEHHVGYHNATNFVQ